MGDDDHGAIATAEGAFGQSVPVYALIFDPAGTCTSPRAREAILARAVAEDFTDLIVYSHGWNNDWATARALYDRSLAGVSDLAAANPGLVPPEFKPLFVGIHWPSAALVWPWEQAPDIAARGQAPDDLAVLADAMSRTDAERLRALAAQGDALGPAELRDLATVLAPYLSAGDPAEPEIPEAALIAEDVEDMLRRVDRALTPGNSADGGLHQGGIIGRGPGSPDVAAGTGTFSLRRALRLATVLIMKDRAGVVGRLGMAETVGLLLSETQARLHLVGHSYGAKVVMTALVHAASPRKARSALLLQPAVNLLCFSPDVLGREGAFRPALQRIERPILTTRSRHDFPLRRVFQLAVRRRQDLGELQFAAADAPTQFSAMGGYGPANLLEGEKVTIIMPGGDGSYDPPAPSVRVVDLEASAGIGGHSDVSNPHTFRAMLENLR